MRSTPPSAIGIDIAPDAVRAAAIRCDAQGPTLLGVTAHPLPTDAVVDGRIVGSAAVARAIRAAATRLGSGAVTLSASGPETVLTVVEMPALSDAELAESIEWEADAAIPFDLATMALEYRVVARSEAESSISVSVSGLPRAQLDIVVGVGRKAALEVRAVELVAEALRRAHTLAGVRTDAKPAAIVELAGGRVTMVVLVWGQAVFVREAAAVGEGAVTAIKRTLGTYATDARDLAEVIVAGPEAAAVAGALGGIARPWAPGEILTRADGVGIPDAEFATALGLAMPAAASNVIGTPSPKKGWLARLLGR